MNRCGRVVARTAVSPASHGNSPVPLLLWCDLNCCNNCRTIAFSAPNASFFIASVNALPALFLKECPLPPLIFSFAQHAQRIDPLSTFFTAALPRRLSACSALRALCAVSRARAAWLGRTYLPSLLAAAAQAAAEESRHTTNLLLSPFSISAFCLLLQAPAVVLSPVCLLTYPRRSASGMEERGLCERAFMPSIAGWLCSLPGLYCRGARFAFCRITIPAFVVGPCARALCDDAG